MTAVRQAVSAQDTCLSAFLWEPSGLASHGGIPHAIPAPGEAEPAIVTEPEEVAEVLRASEQGGATASAPARTSAPDALCFHHKLANTRRMRDQQPRV